MGIVAKGAFEMEFQSASGGLMFSRSLSGKIFFVRMAEIYEITAKMIFDNSPCTYIYNKILKKLHGVMDYH